MSNKYEAVVVGSGPNGLAAAITLARAGIPTLIREANDTVGGAMRSMPLTGDGFIHDFGSTVQALAQVSPFFKSLPLKELGVEFCFPKISFGQTLPDGAAAVCVGSVDETADRLGVDGRNYRKLIGPIVRNWEDLIPTLLAPPGTIPRHPLKLASFGLKAIRSVQSLTDSYFRTPAARALFGGAAAHAILPFDRMASAAFGLVLTASAHVAGWPVVKGGSQVLADAMAAYFVSLGGKIVTGAPVQRLKELEDFKTVLCDITPRQLLTIAGDALPRGYQSKLQKFRYGPAAFKMDWALSSPVPWSNADLRSAGTVHVGASFEEYAASESASWTGAANDRPFVLVVQPGVMDDSRAPAGRQTLWAYSHVPNGSTEDFAPRIEAQIERYAPGFADTIITRSVLRPSDLERLDMNLIGGDITGGAQTFWQTAARPVARFNPYATPVPGLYLCSASTPPGGGVHGMAGMQAAQSAIAKLR